MTDRTRLAYISNAEIPSQRAHSVHIMKMCSAFASKGFSVDLIAVKGLLKKGNSDDPFDIYSVENNFRIHYLRWFHSLPGKTFLFALMSALKALSVKPDIIYGRFLFGIYTAARLGKDVVFETHSDEFNNSPYHRRMIRFLEQSDRCRHVIVISEALKKAYVDEFPGLKRKITVAHDGADRVAPTDRPSDRNMTQFTAAYVGHLYPGKGMETISKMAEALPDIHFRVVGGTENDIRHWKKKLNRLSNIEFTGYVTHHKVFEMIRDSDLLLAPFQKQVYVGSTSGTEISRWMSPLKVFEYMSLGKPILASDLPVIREILSDGVNAILCDPDHPEEWVDALNKLQQDGDLRERLGEHARLDFEKKYTWRKRAENLINLMERL